MISELGSELRRMIVLLQRISAGLRTLERNAIGARAILKERRHVYVDVIMA